MPFQNLLCVLHLLQGLTEAHNVIALIINALLFMGQTRIIESKNWKELGGLLVQSPAQGRRHSSILEKWPSNLFFFFEAPGTPEVKCLEF